LFIGPYWRASIIVGIVIAEIVGKVGIKYNVINYVVVIFDVFIYIFLSVGGISASGVNTIVIIVGTHVITGVGCSIGERITIIVYERIVGF
jgi:hypothetical protein